MGLRDLFSDLFGRSPYRREFDLNQGSPTPSSQHLLDMSDSRHQRCKETFISSSSAAERFRGVAQVSVEPRYARVRHSRKALLNDSYNKIANSLNLRRNQNEKKCRVLNRTLLRHQSSKRNFPGPARGACRIGLFSLGSGLRVGSYD